MKHLFIIALAWLASVSPLAAETVHHHAAVARLKAAGSGGGGILESLRTDAEVHGFFHAITGNLKTGTVADFNASSNDQLAITDAAQTGLAPSGDFSVCSWVKLPADGASMGIATKWTTTGNQRSYALYKTGTGDKFRVTVSADGSASTTLTSAVSADDSWQFVCLVHDGIDIKISVDGAAFETATFAGPVFDCTYDFRIGSLSGASFADGPIGQTLFYSKALSIAQVQAIYASGDGTRPADFTGDMLTSLVSRWNLHEPTGTTRADDIGSNDLTDSTSVPTSVFVGTGTAEDVQYNAVAGSLAQINRWVNTATTIDAARFGDADTISGTSGPIMGASFPEFSVGGLETVTGSMAQPSTTVIITTANSTAGSQTLTDSGDGTARQLVFVSGGDLDALAGATIAGPAWDTSRHVVIFEANGASSKLIIDGSETAADAGTDSLSAGIALGVKNDGTNFYDGAIETVIFIDRLLTSDEKTALNAL